MEADDVEDDEVKGEEDDDVEGEGDDDAEVDDGGGLTSRPVTRLCARPCSRHALGLWARSTSCENLQVKRRRPN